MLEIIRHNQGMFIAVIISIFLMVWTFGCDSTVQSPISGKQVTRTQLRLELSIESKRLEGELDALLKRADLQFAELDRQDNIKQKLYEFAALSAANNTLNPMGIITLAGSILGFGAVVDNRIKDKVIANRPLTNSQPV